MESRPLTDEELEEEIADAERLLTDAEARLKYWSDRCRVSEEPKAFFRDMLHLEESAVSLARKRVHIGHAERTSRKRPDA